MKRSMVGFTQGLREGKREEERAKERRNTASGREIRRMKGFSRYHQWDLGFFGFYNQTMEIESGQVEF